MCCDAPCGEGQLHHPFKPKMYNATASYIRVQGSWNLSQSDPDQKWISMNHPTFKVKDDNAMVDVRVDITLDDASWNIEPTYPKLKVYKDDLTGAKNASLFPPDGTATTMLPE